MTHEELGAAIVSFLVVMGLVGLGIVALFKKFGFGKNCVEACPDPSCQGFVKETRDNAALAATAVVQARESIIKLQEGQNYVTKILDQKRVKIEVLQQDTAEIKTDVKWLVQAFRKKNNL